MRPVSFYTVIRYERCRDQLSCPNECQLLWGGRSNAPQKPPEPKKPTKSHLPLPPLDSWLGTGPTISHTSYQNRFPWGVLVSHDQKEILVENYICPSVPHTHTPINRLEGFPISFITDAHLPSKHSPWHEISSGEFSFGATF